MKDHKLGHRNLLSWVNSGQKGGNSNWVKEHFNRWELGAYARIVGIKWGNGEPIVAFVGGCF